MKVTIQAKKAKNVQKVPIHTEFIKLQDLMKFCDLVGSGGTAKNLIQDGLVTVNGEVCTMRGKKLRDGDTITFEGRSFTVCHEAE